MGDNTILPDSGTPRHAGHSWTYFQSPERRSRPGTSASEPTFSADGRRAWMGGKLRYTKMGPTLRAQPMKPTTMGREKQSRAGRKYNLRSKKDPKPNTPPATPPRLQGEAEEERARATAAGTADAAEAMPGETVEVPATQVFAGGSTRELRYAAAIDWVAGRLGEGAKAKAKETQMVDKALALGNSEVLAELRALLQRWRREGTCVPSVAHGEVGQRELASAEIGRPWLSGVDGGVRPFVVLWDRTANVRTMTYLHNVLYRLNMARLEVTRRQLASQTSSKGGKREATVTNATMMSWLYGGEAQPRATLDSFAATMKYAKRWDRFCTDLGYGMACLVAPRMKSYIEQSLGNEKEYGIWLRLVRDFNQPAMRLAAQLWPLLEAGLKGAPLDVEPTVLECWHDNDIEVDLLGAGWLQSSARVLSTPGPYVAPADWEACLADLCEPVVFSSSPPQQPLLTHTQALGQSGDDESEMLEGYVSQESFASDWMDYC